MRKPVRLLTTPGVRQAGGSRIAVLGLCLAAATLGADWPQFRGAARDGISTESGILKSWPEGGPTELWRIQLGEGYSGISVVGNRVYTAYASGSDEYAACYDAATGKRHWNYKLDSKWLDRFGNGPRSSPTVADGIVYVLSGSGTLAALSADDGSALWSKDLQALYSAKPPEWGVSTQPHVEGDLLLVNVGGKGASVVAFNRKSGAEVWKALDDAAGYSAPIVFEVGDVRQAVFFTARGLVGLAPEDGTLLWRQDWETSYDVNASTPIFVEPDRLFVSTGYDVGAALYRIEPGAEGFALEEIWRNREMKNKFSSSILHDGFIYGFDEKTLKCVELETGETRWRQRDLGHGTLIYADGHFVVLGEAGQLVLIKADSDTYKEVGRTQVFKGKTWTMPTLAGGQLYLRDEKELVALKVSK